ncbi:MAG: hypothetical protein A2043_02005 [Candidatus Schekmanbacteria bacterium GWA2_38_9]|uniref:Type I restriction modification DNA specificity domain-containing protein n=1 Tax=Candidatus Schekmanbacteria bacterium RIFCSPLOWO2_12_FULL_38_15 TaxID=1817883 RepID=A0A1F7SKA9_9BACT|nr:MAG: hypothetical protein A2043_02005 [Candidatus Schekmanbacteria bacterium GWA2_38_9]OGL51261.1 MAG: hypothetical protein A3H37_10635 [Candidatus Schekmanbacteria bacterium RIFCSPLOWO2_02_FULL_38_14]OGL54212.1 MAG: hypothetical protein A3G31_05475 [Candidatus Schekmanbacteria bacterium RIFCSPLOWO2_12_FULL_38_15]
MITYSIIQKSQLESANRLDAEYYQPEYFIDYSKGNWKPIGSFLEICQYGISQAMNENAVGCPIFRMDDIKNAFLMDDEVKYVEISKNIFTQFKLEKNDVLFNRVNSEDFVGRTGIFKLDGIFVFASYLVRLRVKKEDSILADYLNIFLNSSFGIKQIRKFRRRAVNQANVNAEELKQIRIPVFPQNIQKEIEQLSNESWNNYELSKALYSQAEDLLLEELGLKDFKPEEDLSCTVNLSEVKSAHRADAEYFQPKYEKIIEKIKKYGAEVLLNIVENVPAKFNPLTQPDKLFKYVELSNINSSIGIIDGYSEVSGQEAPGRAKRVLKTNDVIVSSVEGSLEKVALANKEQDGFLASTGFFQFRGKEILPEVLLVLAKSLVLQMQLEKQCAGTILTAVPKEAIKNVFIPILPKSIQQKIADLVRQSHEARRKAKELLEEAKRKVEEMIEKKCN